MYSRYTHDVAFTYIQLVHGVKTITLMHGVKVVKCGTLVRRLLYLYYAVLEVYVYSQFCSHPA